MSEKKEKKEEKSFWEKVGDVVVALVVIALIFQLANLIADWKVFRAERPTVAVAIAGSSCNDCVKDNGKEEVNDVSINDYNIALLKSYGFPAETWIVPDEVKNLGWKCPERIAPGQLTFGPYSETKDAMENVWIGFDNKKASMAYTYSYAACANPAASMVEAPFVLGTENNHINGKNFNVILNGVTIPRIPTYPTN